MGQKDYPLQQAEKVRPLREKEKVVNKQEEIGRKLKEINMYIDAYRNIIAEESPFQTYGATARTRRNISCTYMNTIPKWGD